MFGRFLWILNTFEDVATKVLTVPFFLVVVVIIPGQAVHTMFKARDSGRLHSKAFEAEYGWLCSRYRAQAYWWDLLYLECALPTDFPLPQDGGVLTRPTDQQLIQT